MAYHVLLSDIDGQTFMVSTDRKVFRLTEDGRIDNSFKSVELDERLHNAEAIYFNEDLQKLIVFAGGYYLNEDIYSYSVS